MEYPGIKSLGNHNNLDFISFLWEGPAGSKFTVLCHLCSTQLRNPTYPARRVQKKKNAIVNLLVSREEWSWENHTRQACRKSFTDPHLPLFLCGLHAATEVTSVETLHASSLSSQPGIVKWPTSRQVVKLLYDENTGAALATETTVV